jgi:AcrR family transcriptional regulator
MAIRGDKLTEHILWTAKDVFLELGFERASMDVVANRAKASKRTVYAHFENKEKLFLAVIQLVRELFLSRLRLPADYSDKPVEALTRFCGRYAEILLYEASIQMLRVSMAESERFPEQAAQYFDALFEEVHRRVSTYLKLTFEISSRNAAEATDKLFSSIFYPRLIRALFGLETLAKSFAQEDLPPTYDLRLIRRAVNEVLKALPNS